MCEAIGHPVTALRRVAIGSITTTAEARSMAGTDAG
jgi:16S rRNA U516 pseudouridylate synthase RsuA-like enzyme